MKTTTKTTVASAAAAAASDAGTAGGKGKSVPANSNSKTVAKKARSTSASARAKSVKNNYQYSNYIHKVLKQVNGPRDGDEDGNDITISRAGMIVMNDMMGDLFERLAVEAKQLRKVRRSKTITGKEMESAVRVILPGELAKWGTIAGTKAVMQFNAWPAECESLSESESSKQQDTAPDSADGMHINDYAANLPATATTVNATEEESESNSPLSPVDYRGPAVQTAKKNLAKDLRKSISPNHNHKVAVKNAKKTAAAAAAKKSKSKKGGRKTVATAVGIMGGFDA
jgi:histone H2B